MPEISLLLEPATEYGVRIRAYDGNSWSEWSEPLSVTTISDDSPSAPTNLTATTGPRHVMLRWSNLEAPIGWTRVYISTSSITVGTDGRVTGIAPYVNVDADSVIVSLGPGTYYSRVEVVDQNGNIGPASSQVEFTVGADAISNARTDYTATDVDTPEEIADALNSLGATINAILTVLRDQGMIQNA